MSPRSASSILIVEDEPIVALDLQQTLADFGYGGAAIAASSEEAIAAASLRCPDLVLMDIRIKGEPDGIVTAQLLRERFGVPVVYLTAHADEATVDRAKRTEPQGYLLKPVKSAELRTVVELALHRHRLEKQLKERERWFSTTLRSIADAVVAVDLAGRVTFLNRAAEQLTGRSSADAVGRPAREVLQLSLDPADEPLERALREGEVVALHEGRVRNVVTGSERLIDDSAAPVKDDVDTFGAVMVFRDVTEQRSLQRQLEIADRLASLGTLAAGVAHEINNPLAVIVANIEYVHEAVEGLRAPSAEAQRRRFDEVLEASGEIATAARAISEIVADLRSFSRPAGPSAGEADVARAVSWSLRSVAPELRQRARVSTELQHVPRVQLDETRLGQVLVNLLVNAAHAIEPGHVEQNLVSLSVRSDRDARVVIEVTDTGSGIPAALLGRIFDPFFTTKPQGQGTGLGLSICHGIVRAAGGTISVVSEVGRGSTFRVELPAVVVPREEPRAPVAESKAARRGRVLVVDDEPTVRSAMARVLRDHEVVTVASALEALEVLAASPPFDVIVSDLVMPGLTGADFYERLLASRPDDARRVVFLSGGIVDQRSADFFAAIPNPRLDKPFAPGELLAVVQRFVSSDASARGPQTG